MVVLKKILQGVDEQRGKVRLRIVDNVKEAFRKFKEKVTPKCFEKEGGNNDDADDDGSNDASTWRVKFRRARREEAEPGGRIWLERLQGGVFVPSPVATEEEERSLLGFEPPRFPKSPSDSDFLEAALVGSFIFSRLSREELIALLSAFEEWTVKKGTIIFQEAEPGDYFYVIKQGTVQFIGNEQPNRIIDKSRTRTGASAEEKKTGFVAHPTSSAGEYFGELALLYDCNHYNTCEAVTDCTLWRLERRLCRKVMAKHSVEYDVDAKRLLKSVYLFKDIDDTHLTLIAHALATKTYQDGEEVLKKGDDCHCFYIVRTGQVHATDIVIGESKYDDTILNPGDSFGERVIIDDIPIPGNVRAVGETTLLWMSREVFLKLFGGWGCVITRSIDRKLLNLLPIPGRKHELLAYEVDALADLIVEQSFPKGHVFFREGVEVPPAVYFIRTGRVAAKSSMKEITAQFSGLFRNESTRDSTGTSTTTATTSSSDSGRLKVIQAGGYFGIDMLKAQNAEAEAITAPYTVEAEEDCKIGMLTMTVIWSVVGGRLQYGGGALNVEDFEKHKLLGAGNFARVYLVTNKQSSSTHLYALKIQNKRALIKHNIVEDVLRERNIMLRLNHPSVVRLVQSSQDVSNVYMLTELYQGGELRTIIQSCDYGMPERAAAFYAGGMLEALSFMHVRRILHRDLKPENVMLDCDGYPVLIDLGFARIVHHDKTYTFCGTPMYMAPEVIAERGYGRSADLWSWAVILFEMIVGITPFCDTDMDQISLFRRIAAAEYEFPPYKDWMTYASRDLLRRMLKPCPRDRLGHQRDAKDVKNHSWFRLNRIDFAKLSKREEEAPWEPKIVDPLEFEAVACEVTKETLRTEMTVSEDATTQREEEKPLTEKEQELFKDF